MKLAFQARSQKREKETISFVVFVRLSTWNNSAPTGGIFIKFVEFISKNCQENSNFTET
jgi:hypothetical protein